MRFCKILFHRALQRREGAPFGASNRICNALWGKRLRKIADPTPEFRLNYLLKKRLHSSQKHHSYCFRVRYTK